MISAQRVLITDSPTSFGVPTWVTSIIVRNTSALISARINFDSDGSSNYWTISPGEVSPVLNVRSGQTINTDGVGGSTTVEILMWG